MKSRSLSGRPLQLRKAYRLISASSYACLQAHQRLHLRLFTGSSAPPFTPVYRLISASIYACGPSQVDLTGPGGERAGPGSVTGAERTWAGHHFAAEIRRSPYAASPRKVC
jgi:hypothetical protein